jgi:AcrR family transcriptional regulator
MPSDITAAAPRYSRLDRAERRSQILACARRLFAERHYAAVSTSEIAAEAGVTRGLLHHYFGTKRDLYLEVVRDLARMPPPPLPAVTEGRPVEDVVAESVSLWLDVVSAQEHTWLAAIGAEGFGRDPELEAILEEARESTAEHVLRVLGLEGRDARAPELRAVIRAFGGMAEQATREWLERGRLNREQVHRLLADTLLAMVRDVLPRMGGR